MAVPISKQTDRGIVVAFKEQTVIGTPVSGAGAESLRFASSPGLSLETANVASTESRNDGLARAAGLGRKQVSGTFNGPASINSYDTFDAAALRSTWTAAATIAETDLSSATLTLASNVGTISTGSWITAGLRVGMTGYFSSGEDVAAASADRYVMVTAVTATTATFTPINGTALTDEGPLSDWTFNVARTGIQGTTDCAFTIEQYRDRIDRSELFEWVRVGSMGYSLSPDQEVQRTFGFFGRNQTVLATAASPNFTTPTEYTTDAFQSAKTKLIIGTSQIVGLSQFSMTLNLNPFRDESVDELTSEIGVGQPSLTASVTVLEDDLSRVESYLNGTETTIGIVTEYPGTSPAGFESISFTKAKFGAATASGMGADRFSTRTFPLLIDADLRGGAYDATMVRLSNSGS